MGELEDGRGAWYGESRIGWTMCARLRRQNQTARLFQNRNCVVFRKINRKCKRIGRDLQREKINPTRLIVGIRSLDLVFGVRFRFMVIQKMRVNQRFVASMIIVWIMRVIERRGDQCDKDCDHTQVCAKPLHIGDSYVPETRSQPRHLPAV
jgi:hypothetical protein